LIEYVVRRSLARDRQELVGVNPDRPQKGTARPTTERLLRAFKGVTLTVIQMKEQEQEIRHLTPLSSLQEEILKRLDLEVELYGNLEIHKTAFR
jgi:hypothetical protein